MMKIFFFGLLGYFFLSIYSIEDVSAWSRVLDYGKDGHKDILNLSLSRLNYYRGEGNGQFFEQPCFGEPAFSTDLDYLNFSDNPLVDTYLGSIDKVSNIDMPDWDGDGDFDIVVGYGTSDFTIDSYSATVRLFTNQGNDTFDYSGTLITIENVSDMDGFAPDVGDWDADGDFDLLISPSIMYTTPPSAEIWLYSNDGSNNFSKTTLVEISTETLYANAVMVDWNSDGLNDILSGVDDGSLVRFINQGNNIFTSQSNFGSIDVDSASQPEVVDWDSDGDLDIFIDQSYYNESSFRLFLNDGDDTFTEDANFFSISDTGECFENESSLGCSLKQ